MKDAVLAEFAGNQRLGIIFECIRRRFHAPVTYAESLSFFALGILLNNGKVRIRANLLDGSRLHIPRYPQPPTQSLLALLVQLGNGDVVALAFLHSGPEDIAEGHDNHANHDAKANVF